MIAAWLVEVTWWMLARQRRPFRWLIGSAVFLQLAFALFDGNFEAGLRTVRIVGMGLALELFLDHVRHPWALLDAEERLARVRAPFIRHRKLAPRNPHELLSALLR